MDKQKTIRMSVEQGRQFIDLLNQEMKELQDIMKQIEEMASDMDYACVKHDLWPDDAKEIAKVLAALGYRKIPEGAVVVSRAEYNDLKGLEKHFDDYLIKEIIETRKETAEKFAERLKEDVSEDNELHERLNYYLKRDYFEYIDERCKEIIGETK